MKNSFKKGRLDLDIDLLKIILLVTHPFLLISLLCIFLLSTIGKNGKIYSIDEEYLQIYRIVHNVCPKKIPLSNINEVVIYHSWFEILTRMGGESEHKWTVRVNYLNDKQIHFIINAYDHPDYKRPTVKEMSGYSAFEETNNARDYLIRTFKEHGVNCRVE